MSQAIGRKLWVPGDAALAQRIADAVCEPSDDEGHGKLSWLAERAFGVTDGGERAKLAGDLDCLVLRHPFAFMFVPGPDDGIDRVMLRPEPGPDDVRARFEDMSHFQLVAPTPEPRARAWVKRRAGWCRSCGDPLATPDGRGWCQPCERPVARA